MTSLRITAIQNSAGPDIEQNLARIESLLNHTGKADVYALPEMFATRGNDADYRQAAESLSGRIIHCLADLAIKRRAWILAGGIPEKKAEHIFNASVLLDRGGKIKAVYRKIHLFEALLDNGTRVREADVFSAGQTPVVTEIEGWPVGLTICYDLRFPELFRYYAQKGCRLIFAPSNFTRKTGRDHWEVLARARAIENQCYIIAPDQCGTNARTGVASYGHSMIIGPWGNVIARARTRETCISARINLETVENIRTKIPALKHNMKLASL